MKKFAIASVLAIATSTLSTTAANAQATQAPPTGATQTPAGSSASCTDQKHDQGSGRVQHLFQCCWPNHPGGEGSRD